MWSDPLQLDYRLITDVQKLLAERHLIVTLDDQKEAMTLAMAEPWNQELHKYGATKASEFFQWQPQTKRFTSDAEFTVFVLRCELLS